MMRPDNMIKIVIVLICLVLMVSSYFGFHGWTASSGFKEVEIQKFGKTGIVIMTWEGEGATPGIRATKDGGMTSTFAFSVWDDNVAQQINDMPTGQKCRLYYKKHRFVSPFKAFTGYEVWKIERP